MAVTNGYATRAALKAWLSLDSANADHDEDVDRVLNASSRLIDRYCGRLFYRESTTAAPTAKTFRAEVAYELDIADIWSQTGLVVATDEDADGTYETTWVAADFILEPTNPDPGWPWRRIVAVDKKTFPTGSRRSQVRITAAWGWTAVPPEVEQGCLVIGAELFKRKDAPFGVVGFDQIGAPVRIPASVVPLLEPLTGFRRMVFGAV